MSEPLFSRSQLQGLLFLLPLLLIIALGVIYAELYIDPFGGAQAIDKEYNSRDTVSNFEPFDPNVVSVQQLREMGLTKYESVSIIRYREAGKVYHIKEDLLTCYGITDSLYSLLEPYIEIDPQFQYKRREYKTTSYKRREYQRDTVAREPLHPFRIDTVGVEFLTATGLLSPKQAVVFVKWRIIVEPKSREQLRECYVVNDSIADVMGEYAIFPPVVDDPIFEPIDINKADSAELRRVWGIGEKSSAAIVAYRQKLGGFYSVDQLSEVKSVTESNFEKILQQIYCNNCDISKIYVNFAPAKQLKEHPYISDKSLRRFLKVRQLKGGWSNTTELIEDDIFTKEEAQRLSPYLDFGVGHNRE